MTEQPWQLQVGLIGYGYAGKTFHAPLLTSLRNLRLAKVVERSAKQAKERYPWVESVDHVHQLYEDSSIDLIVITTPSTQHYKFVKEALEAGKHVVVEKPFTTTSEEADELIALAKKKGKVLSVFHNRRWDGDFLTIQDILRQGLLGQIRECEFHWNGFDPVMTPGNWRETAELGSGIVYDLGAHFLDQALCLFGIPLRIGADIRIQREGALAHDYFDIDLYYTNELKVTLKSSRFVRERAPRYIVHGTKGSFVKHGTDPQELALIQGCTPTTIPNWGAEPKDSWGQLHSSIGQLHVEGIVETIPGSYATYYQNIFDHIIGQSELYVTAEEARITIRLIELAIQSSEQGKVLPVVL